jgi:hypothetical protein
MLFSRSQNLLLVCVQFCAEIVLERFFRLHIEDLAVVDERSRFWPEADAVAAAKIPGDVLIVAAVRHPWERFVVSCQGNGELIDKRLEFLKASAGSLYLTAAATAGTNLPCCPDQVLVGGDSVPRMRSQVQTLARVPELLPGKTVDKLLRLDSPDAFGAGLKEIPAFARVQRLPEIRETLAGSWKDHRAAAEGLHTIDREQLLREVFPEDYTQLGFSPY